MTGEFGSDRSVFSDSGTVGDKKRTERFWRMYCESRGFRSVRKESVPTELEEKWCWINRLDSLVKTGKLSGGEQWVEERDGANEESEEVMTKSRMWFLLWVEKFRC